MNKITNTHSHTSLATSTTIYAVVFVYLSALVAK